MTQFFEREANAPPERLEAALPGKWNEGGHTPATPMFLHLRRSELFRSFKRAFEATTGLPLVLRHPGSFEFPLHGSQRLNPCYSVLASNTRTCVACLEFEQQLEAAATREPATLVSFTGLSESAVPVWVAGRLVAHLRTGQVFVGTRRIRRLPEQMELPAGSPARDALDAAYRASRVVSEAQYVASIKLLAIFAQQLAAIGNHLVLMESKAEAPGIARARAFMDEHYSDQLHLADVAHAAGMSAFYFCKLFRRTTGHTFSRHLAEVRVNAAKAILQNANMRVCDAAYAAGFQSLSQFNRIFRRVAGETPTKYRARIHVTATHQPLT